MNLEEITNQQTLELIIKSCGEGTPDNYNKPDPNTHVSVKALIGEKVIDGLAAKRTLNDRDIRFYHPQPQLLFPERMEYMGEYVSKKNWCYPSPEHCRFKNGKCRFHTEH